MKHPQAVLFDLDGTLIDSAPDIISALNLMRTARNLPPLELQEVRKKIAGGSLALLPLALGVDGTDPSFPTLRQEFFSHYERTLLKQARLYPGIRELMQTLGQLKIPYGIVTNKLKRHADPVIDLLELSPPPAVLIGAQCAGEAKPSAKPIWMACDAIGVAPMECIFVGDSEIDVAAAKNAGMPVYVAGYGDALGPLEGQAGYLTHPLDLLRIWDAQP